MKRLLKFGFALAALTGVAATVDLAKADTISIGYSLTMNGAVTTLASGTGSASYGGGQQIGSTDFFATGISASGSPPLKLPSLLATNNLSLTTDTGGTIFIWITESDITLPSTGVQPFVSKFTDDNDGVTAILQTFYNANDAVYGHVTSIGGPFTFLSQGLSVDKAQTNIALTGDPYSITAMYELIAAPNASVDDVISVSVPGPVVGAGLPGLLAACGGLIALARRRRRKAA